MVVPQSGTTGRGLVGSAAAPIAALEPSVQPAARARSSLAVTGTEAVRPDTIVESHAVVAVHGGQA
jgi:hypothetical protein